MPVPAGWRSRVVSDGAGFTVRGDKTAAPDLLLSATAGVVVSDRIEDVVERLRSNGVEPRPSAFAVSALLQSGLVPPPHSEFEDIYTLTMGDVVRVSWPDDRPRLDFDIDYPWFAGRSRNDGDPSERKLLDLLTAATVADLDAAGGSGFLMLSSGKDSAAVALALAEAGRTDVPCVTYRAGMDDPEPAVAADICRRLGLEHRVVDAPADPVRVEEILTRFFEVAPRPGTDLKQIPYVFATASAGCDGGTVIDGGGNDSYMGYPVTGRWAMKTRLRLRGRWLRDFVQQHTPVDSPVNYLARSRLETMLAGRLLRFHELSRFMPGAVDAGEFWAGLSQETARLDLFDVYAFIERYATPPASMKKHTLSANAIGCTASVPWCNHEIADYYFNLPEEHRYDRKRGVNKLLLRRMLLEYLDYDADEIGKHYFSFDGARFVARNRGFIRSEIVSCDLWDRDRLGTVIDWLDAVDTRPLLHHAILTLFMVSGWHNHSSLDVATLAPNPAMGR
jgi:asparagine synthase (glutamine-hydrolysing)